MIIKFGVLLYLAISENEDHRAMIAALYVMRDGCYYGMPDVDPWDEERDARLYAGPYAVVAHPPCERWGRYWGEPPDMAAFAER